jgi:hypothetical protein
VYSTCLFCNESLGKNEVIEHFPVGRRLAYDAAKGRLWVVCRKCERWNLTPLEERWEAIEEAERRFTETRLRVSTDNIGLAKLREGLELVRIGSALRPEMAAWRYGDQFGKRRRKHLVLTTAGIAVVAGVVVAGPASGIIAGGGWGLWQGMSGLYNAYQNRRTRLTLRLPGASDVVTIRKQHLDHTTLTRDSDGWMLNLSYDPRGKWTVAGRAWQMMELRGEAAIKVAGQVMPKINASGAKAAQVQDAVKLLERQSDPLAFFANEARQPHRFGPKSSQSFARITAFPIEVRLALEMAAHEEQERRALEGELALLEAAWREAEEVAQIADDMFVPESALTRFDQLKSGG